MQWNTRKANPAKKSRGDRYPATGRSWNPVLCFKKLLTSCSWGRLSSRYPQYLTSSGQFSMYSGTACFAYNLCNSLKTTPLKMNFVRTSRKLLSVGIHLPSFNFFFRVLYFWNWSATEGKMNSLFAIIHDIFGQLTVCRNSRSLQIVPFFSGKQDL